MKFPLILDYEIYDEDGPCAPYFTGRITDADGRVMCNAENEERAALLARHTALREAVAWERECWSCPLKNSSNAEKKGFSELWTSRRAARAEVDRLLVEE